MKLKNLILISLIALFIFSASAVKAQSISAGFELGVGTSYIFENIESGNQINYEPSFTTGINLKFQPSEAYFALRFNLLYVSTTFNGLSWRNIPYNGEVSSFTTSILLEHLNDTKKWNLGYHFGMGITREDYSRAAFLSNTSDIRNYMSISISGIISHKITDRSAFQISPVILWTDPINSFRTNNWYNGREDASVLLQFGYTYTLN